MVNNNRFHNRDSHSPRLKAAVEEGQHLNNNCNRLKRFTQYLENRGCPVKLVFNKQENEIRWLG